MPTELNLYRQLINLGHQADRVLFVLRPELMLSFLYREEHGLKWGGETEEQAAAASLYLGLKSAAACQADLILEQAPEVFLFSTYISNLLWSMMLARELKFRCPDTPLVFGGPGVGLPEVQGFVLSTHSVAVFESGRALILPPQPANNYFADPPDLYFKKGDRNGNFNDN